jgi:hypothetical protein
MIIPDSGEPVWCGPGEVRVTEREELTGVRGDERSRMITFDSDSLTIMIGVHRNRNGTIRLDGWLSPAGSHPIELRTDTGTMTTNSDINGRFAFDQVPLGSVQLAVRPTGGNHTISTPAIALQPPDGT